MSKALAQLRNYSQTDIFCGTPGLESPIINDLVLKRNAERRDNENVCIYKGDPGEKVIDDNPCVFIVWQWRAHTTGQHLLYRQFVTSSQDG